MPHFSLYIPPGPLRKLLSTSFEKTCKSRLRGFFSQDWSCISVMTRGMALVARDVTTRAAKGVCTQSRLYRVWLGSFCPKLCVYYERHTPEKNKTLHLRESFFPRVYLRFCPFLPVSRMIRPLVTLATLSLGLSSAMGAV